MNVQWLDTCERDLAVGCSFYTTQKAGQQMLFSC